MTTLNPAFFTDSLTTTKKQIQNNRTNQQPPTKPTEKTPDPTLDIQITPTRIKLCFSAIPSKTIRETLIANRFWCHPSNHAWSIPDTQMARDFLNSFFSVNLNPKNIVQDAPESIITTLPYTWLPPEPSQPILATPEPSPIELDGDVSPEFARYRVQVNELLEYLKCEPADLMILAIDNLHRTTFGKPN